MDSAQDARTGQVLACEESFFSAPLAADQQTLATILADDFVIVDVMSGQAARRQDLPGANSSGKLPFADVRQYTEERSVRHRNSLAVVIGRRFPHDLSCVHRWSQVLSMTPVTARADGGVNIW